MCGAKHPDLDLHCTGRERKPAEVGGKPRRHLGDHRVRPLKGIVHRWPVDDEEEE